MNKNLQTYLVLLMLLLSIQACEKDPIILERNYPRIDISESIVQEATGITFEGLFLTEKGEILDKGFTWKSTTTPFLHNSPSVSLGGGYSKGSFQASICDDFVAGTEYRIRAYAVTRDKTIYSRTLIFICQQSCQ